MVVVESECDGGGVVGGGAFGWVGGRRWRISVDINDQ
jgi:hypothetical protein